MHPRAGQDNARAGYRRVPPPRLAPGPYLHLRGTQHQREILRTGGLARTTAGATARLWRRSGRAPETTHAYPRSLSPRAGKTRWSRPGPSGGEQNGAWHTRQFSSRLPLVASRLSATGEHRVCTNSRGEGLNRGRVGRRECVDTGKQYGVFFTRGERGLGKYLATGPRGGRARAHPRPTHAHGDMSSPRSGPANRIDNSSSSLIMPRWPRPVEAVRDCSSSTSGRTSLPPRARAVVAEALVCVARALAGWKRARGDQRLREHDARERCARGAVGTLKLKSPRDPEGSLGFFSLASPPLDLARGTSVARVRRCRRERTQDTCGRAFAAARWQWRRGEARAHQCPTHDS